MKALSFFALFMGLTLTSCQSQPTQPAIGTVDAMTFQKRLKETQDKVILDVRTPEEFASGYIENAVLMNYYDPGFNAALGKLDKNKNYFVYCAAAGRSHDVLEEMKKTGFKHVIELGGGIQDWKSKGLPLSKPR